jgi:Ca-activated chloride channel family protein
VKIAEQCATEGTTIDVVQIGNRAPEPIPEVDDKGKVVGIRRDDDGKILTTQLSSEGEAQLAQIAEKTSGIIVRSEGGDVGLSTITARLSKMMKEELSEKVETVYADVFHIPLLGALALLVAEAFVFEARRRRLRAQA